MEHGLRTAELVHIVETPSALFAGPGELPALCRALNWSNTALGSFESWPPALASAIRICQDATAIPMAVWAGTDFTLIYNDAYAALLGPHKHPWALGRAARDVWPDSWDRYGPELRQVMEWGESVQHPGERFVLRSEGRAEEAFFSYAFTPIRDDQGCIIAALNIFHETTGISPATTERKRADDALRRNEALARERLVELQALHETAPIGLCDFDEHLRWLRVNEVIDAMPQIVWTARPDGRIDYHNQRVEELSQFGRRDDGDLRWESAVYAEDVESTLEAWRRAVQEARPYEVTHRLKRADGSTHWYLTRAIPVSDGEGQVVEWFGTTTDIDVQKRTEEDLREANRQKNEFLAMLSHDLRNPIAVIRTSLALLEQAGAESPYGKRALTVLGRQVNQMGRLLDDLLDLTRISTGKLFLERESLELNAIVRAVGEDYAEVFQRERIDFQVIVRPRPLFARVDGARLTQAIGNLLQNAAKFTSEGGRVTLSLRTTDAADALIEVRDNGAGIQPELLGRIFDPLVQADRTLHKSRGGLGLGLAVVKGMVELHGGLVSASSDGPGRGAVFTIQLPLELEACG